VAITPTIPEHVPSGSLKVKTLHPVHDVDGSPAKDGVDGGIDKRKFGVELLGISHIYNADTTPVSAGLPLVEDISDFAQAHRLST